MLFVCTLDYDYPLVRNSLKIVPQGPITNQIIVGTPGKFLDCLEKRRNINTKNVIIFVLDEADQMFIDTGNGNGKTNNSSNQAIATKIISYV